MLYSHCVSTSTETDIFVRSFEPKEFEELAFKLHSMQVKGLVASTIDLKIANLYSMAVETLDS